jgi:hypothetical protein
VATHLNKQLRKCLSTEPERGPVILSATSQFLLEATTPPFVIPTGAKRSGGTCGAPFPNATLLTPEAAVERAVLDGFCDMAYGNVWPCVEICDGAGDF